MRSRMSWEAHVRFCESLKVRFPRATRLFTLAGGDFWLRISFENLIRKKVNLATGILLFFTTISINKINCDWIRPAVKKTLPAGSVLGVQRRSSNFLRRYQKGKSSFESITDTGSSGGTYSSALLWTLFALTTIDLGMVGQARSHPPHPI